MGRNVALEGEIRGMGERIADATEARSQLNSLVAAGMVVLVLLAFGPALATFPIAALGAVLEAPTMIRIEPG